MFYWMQQVALSDGRVVGTLPIPFLTKRGAERCVRRSASRLYYTKLVPVKGWRCP